MPGYVLGKEGGELGSVFLDHTVGLPDEIIVLVARFVKPVYIFLAKDAGFLEAVLQLFEIAPHKASVLFGSLDETGELSRFAAVESTATQAFGPHPVAGESIFPEVLPRRRNEVREIEGDVDLVGVHFEVSFRKEILPGIILVQRHVVEPYGAEVVA